MRRGLITLLLVFCSFAPQKKQIIFELNNSAHNHEKVGFTIKNSSLYVMYCYVAVEIAIGGDWKEIITDVTKPNSKSAELITLKARKFKSITLYKRILLKDYYQHFKTFRFRLYYGKSVDAINNVAYSQSFGFIN